MVSVGLNVAVALSIKQRRIALGLSQEALAELCSLDRTYISSVERRRRNLTLTTLEKIIPHLGLQTDEFFTLVSEHLGKNSGRKEHIPDK